MTNPTIVSRHFLRRRARKKERELMASLLERRAVEGSLSVRDWTRYRVQRARRGPYRWLVIAS